MNLHIAEQKLSISREGRGMNTLEKRPILERIETWYAYAKAEGIELERILIHPEDMHYAPSSYEGLPVVTFEQDT